MTESEANEQAYRILLAVMPPSWIENHKMVMRPKALKLRDLIASGLLVAYRQGQRETKP